ncbi:hypothetical protein EV175_002456 [Coemansia sp. RSA 1933]|nr:hypothetical protein EV175_002456 [Coemansia sp. RSA 1933]
MSSADTAAAVVVTPGRRLGLTQEYESGSGTYARNGMIYASILGERKIQEASTTDTKDSPAKPTVYVERRNTKYAIPVIGSEVLARVVRINPRAASVAIMMVDSAPCQEEFQGIVRVQDIRATEKDLVQMIASFLPGDIIRAEIISLGDQRSYYLSTTKNEHGVVFAQSEAGNSMVPISWEEMQDPKTSAVEKRKCAKPPSWYLYSIPVLVVTLYIALADLAPSLPFQKQSQSVRRFCISKAIRLLILIVKQGPMPNHIAFIMDGNRRYARKSHMEKASSGHFAGFKKLSSVLEWCKELGIGNVSVFAFAINNFNRSPEEVTALMDLAQEKLVELADRSVTENNRYLRIRVAGNMDLLPERVVKAAKYAEEVTKDANVMTLNVCFPYSATDEITSAIRKVVEDTEAGTLEPSDIDETALEKRLMIPRPDLDILVRTSGEIRFSNYMLWQSAKMAYIRFVDVYWPEFSFFHMFKVIISWQMALKDINKRKAQMGIPITRAPR